MVAIHYVLCLYFCLAVLLLPARGKTCHSTSECLADECCVTKSSMFGGCRTKGCRGCECIFDTVKSSVGDMYLMSCPCLKGLVCVPEAIIENKEERTVRYMNSTCKTQEELLIAYKRLLESRSLHPRLLSPILSLMSDEN